MACELVGHLGRRVGGREQIAAADVDLVGERQGHRLAGDGPVQVPSAVTIRATVVSMPDGRDATASPGATVPADDRAGEAAEVEVRAG